MAFDAIETTMANALLLKAQEGETEPTYLKIKPFEELTTYALRFKEHLVLSNLLVEPLGRHFFYQYLQALNKESLLDICTEIRNFRSSKGKSKRRRGKTIIETLRNKQNEVEEIRSSLDVVTSKVQVVARSEMSHGAMLALHSMGKSESNCPTENHMDETVDSIVISDHIQSKEESFIDVGKDLNKMSIDVLSSNHGDTFNEWKSPTTAVPTNTANAIISSTKLANTSSINSEKNEVLDLHLKSDEPTQLNEPSRDETFVASQAMEAMEHAFKLPELFETEHIMDMFDIIYLTLYTQLSKMFFPQFVSTSKIFHKYVQFREYAEMTDVEFDDFNMFRALGKGAFGMVSAVQKKDTKKIYAMKQMKKKKIKHFRSEKLCEIEKAALQRVDSPFVLNLKYSFTDEKSLFLIIDLCNGGDLQFHLQEIHLHRFSEERARFYAAEVILALDHLHKKKYVYRDLKPGNILLDNEGHVVLSDLGLVHRVSSRRPLRTLAGTAGYWAPEVMKRDWYDYTVDWWSFGIFLHKLLSGRRPRCECKRPKQWCPFGIKREHSENAKQGEPMSFSLHFDDTIFSNDAQDLLRKLIEPDQAKRLGAKGGDEIKAHPFFASIAWSDLEHKETTPPFRPTKHGVNAVSLGDISSEGDFKFHKVQIDDKDEAFYDRWKYKSIKTAQEEIICLLKRNKELEQLPPSKDVAIPKKFCCTVQ